MEQLTVWEEVHSELVSTHDVLGIQWPTIHVTELDCQGLQVHVVELILPSQICL